MDLNDTRVIRITKEERKCCLCWYALFGRGKIKASRFHFGKVHLKLTSVEEKPSMLGFGLELTASSFIDRNCDTSKCIV